MGFEIDDSWLSSTNDHEALWARHLPAFAAFLLCQTQWRVAVGMGASRYIGLDYSGCDVALRGAGVQLTPAQWADFQVIERAAMAALNGGDA